MCAAAVLSCGVMGDRWVQPHLAVRTWFAAERWTDQVTQPCRFTPLWLALWVHSVDKSRSSKSAEVRKIWEIMKNVLFGLVLMLVRLTTLLVLETYLALGLLGLLLLRERWLMLSASRVGLFRRGAFAWVEVLRASIGFVWVGPKCVRLGPGALILGMGPWSFCIGTAVLLRWLTCGGG